MVATQRNSVVRPTLIDRCFLLIPVLPFAVFLLTAAALLVLFSHVATWISAAVIGSTALLIMRTLLRTWNCRFSAFADTAESVGRFGTTQVPLDNIRSCRAVQLHPGARRSPIVLGLVLEGQMKPLTLPATFRFLRADREAVVHTMTALGIRVEGTSEYLDQQ
jgi:hypothetical protein